MRNCIAILLIILTASSFGQWQVECIILIFHHQKRSVEVKKSLSRISIALITYLLISPNFCFGQFNIVYSSSGTQSIQDFEFSSSEIGIAAGVSLIPPFISFVLRTSDGGENWVLVDSLPGEIGASNVFTVGADTVFIVGQVNNRDAWKSTDGGLSWGFTQRYSEQAYSQGWFFDSQRALLFRTLASGIENFTYTFDGFDSALDALDSLNCQGVGYVDFPQNDSIGYIACSFPFELKKTTNWGFDWETIAVDGSPFSFLSDSVGFLLTWDAELRKTLDFGVSSSFIAEIPEGVFPQDLLFINEDTGFVVGADTANTGIGYRTEDGGNSWVRMGIPSCPSLTQITCPDILNGTCLANAQKHILRTENFGGVYSPPTGLQGVNSIQGEIFVYQDGNSIVIELKSDNQNSGGVFFISDLLGQEIRSKPSQEMTFRVNNLSEGAYVVGYTSEKFQVSTLYYKFQ